MTGRCTLGRDLVWRAARSSLLPMAMVLAGASSPALAADIRVEDGVLIYSAHPGERNAPEIVAAGADRVRIADQVELERGPGCAMSPDPAYLPSAVMTVQCVGITAGARISLGDGADFANVTLPSGLPTHLDAGMGDDFVTLPQAESSDVLEGGDGVDTLLGGPGSDVLRGGPGDDALFGNEPEAESQDLADDLVDDDTLEGGAGDDRLRGNRGADVLVGGAGEDEVDYGGRRDAVAVTFDGRANDGRDGEQDHVGGDIERVITGSGNDTIRGDAGSQWIQSGAGNDDIDPGTGTDVVQAGEGDDVVRTVDGEIDEIDCGAGRDGAAADVHDRTGADCEDLGRAGTGVQPRATPLRLTTHARIQGRKIFVSGRISLPLGTSPDICTAGTGVVKLVSGKHHRQVRIRFGPSCRFRVTLRPGCGRGRLRIRVLFAGSSTLGAVWGPLRRVRRIHCLVGA